MRYLPASGFSRDMVNEELGRPASNREAASIPVNEMHDVSRYDSIDRVYVLGHIPEQSAGRLVGWEHEHLLEAVQQRLDAATAMRQCRMGKPARAGISQVSHARSSRDPKNR